MKKNKIKKKSDEFLCTIVKTTKEQNEKLVKTLNKDDSKLDQNYKFQMIIVQNEQRKLALKELKEENKILYMNLNVITNLNLHEFTRSKQNKIMQKRSQQQPHQVSIYASSDLSQYFNNIGQSEYNLPEYQK